jgi:hypothetical protein
MHAWGKIILMESLIPPARQERKPFASPNISLPARQECDMPYLPELYYLRDQKDFPFQTAVRVTATAISRWSSHFFAKLIAPTSKQIGVLDNNGPLPEDTQDKETFV